MNGTTKIWGAASVAAIIAVLAGGWFVGAQPQIASAATSAETTLGVAAQNQATRAKLAELSKAAAKLPTMQTENAALLKSVPSILKPNTFIRRINEVAALDGVVVESVSPGDATAYTAPLSASGQAGSDTKVLKIAQVDPLITAANFTAVPATVVVTGTEDSVIQFSHDIQNDERLFAISNVQTSTGDSGSVSATLAGYIFTLKR